MSKKNKEGITVKKEEEFSKWFTQLMIKAELADYTSVSGCMAFRPRSWIIWEKIRDEVDKEFKKLNIENVYFPLLIPEKSFAKEQEHVKGFSPEVAWVTHVGKTKLKEKLAIRPTSEAIMYESFSKWIRSWRDLPLLYNQWSNVIRWEFTHPVPFLRTREFIFNELHTAFATEKEAIKHGLEVMKAYKRITEDLMAIAGIYGRKTDKEKFAGAVFTEKMHHYIPGGKIIEGTCFHHDGQNFSKAYNIKFLDKKGKEDYVWQNTHALSTRMLGTMFAIHSDSKGLVLPPKMAPNKVVIIPILFDNTKNQILKEAKKIKKDLSNLNPILDIREDVSPGRKYNEWELKGIPIRIEIGPRDLQKKSVIVIKRVEGEKQTIKIKDLKKQLPKLLDEIQKDLYKNSKKILKQNQKKTENKKELIKFIKDKQMVMVPLCSERKCEGVIKSETGGAKILFLDPKNTSIEGKKCIICNKPAQYWVYTGKTY